MRLTNDRSAYGAVSMALHWLALIAIVAMFWSGFNADFAEEAGDREARRAFMSLHVSMGASFILLLALRVMAHYAQPQPAPLPQPPALRLLANATHHLLLLAIIVQIISGPLAVWSGGRAINVFSLFSLPSLFPQRSESVHEFAELMHAIGRWALIGLIGLHVLGVLKHVLIDRDNTLRRMLIPGKS